MQVLTTVSRIAYIPTPQAGADAWSAGVGGAQQKYTDGVQNTQVDVVGRAIAQQAVLRANFNQSIDSGLWARRLGDVGTAGWKQATVAKASNYGTGAIAGKSRYLNAAQQLYPYIAQGQAQLVGMPSGTLADAKARSSFWIDYMAGFKAQYAP